MSPITLSLFTGKDCHLCDDASELFDKNELKENYTLQKIDIKSNSDFYHLYAVRIPVLKRHDTQQELGWPFDSASLSEFLK